MESKSNFLLRTMLFAPAHKKELIEKGAKSMADAIILDLEDSCQPASNKIHGRKNIIESLQNKIFGKKKVFVRINPRETGFMFDDLCDVTVAGLDAFLYPMARSKNDIIFFCDMLTEIELSRKLPVGKIKLMPDIETGEGVLNAHEIAKASERIVALGFGSEDFATDIDCVRDEENVSLQIPRQIIVFAARSVGAIPIDTPHVNVHDVVGLEKHIKQARNLGFGGMQILHPKEIDLCHYYYTPSYEEFKDSNKIVHLFDEAKNNNNGVAIMDGKFISPPTYKRALQLIRKHEIIKDFESK